MKAMSALIIIGLMANIAMAKSQPKAPVTCQAAAEDAAAKEMDRQDTQDLVGDDNKPRELAEAEKASVDKSGVMTVDANENEAKQDTGIYIIPMSVMEECIDAMKVTTKKTTEKGQVRCEIIKIEQYGDRDCG